MLISLDGVHVSVGGGSMEPLPVGRTKGYVLRASQ